jgi:hypothetical protein
LGDGWRATAASGRTTIAAGIEEEDVFAPIGLCDRRLNQMPSTSTTGRGSCHS